MDYTLKKAILAGKFSQIHSRGQTRCIKVFLCAHPEESKTQRKALREKVYPKLREYCRHNYGLEFQVFDGYDGIDPDDFNDTQLRQFRLKLLEECLQSSAGPCFVALLGEQYGNSCLPAEIEVSEFENLRYVTQNAGNTTEILETWYYRDENTIPPAYHLLEKEKFLSHYYDKMNDQARETDHKKWQATFNELKSILNHAVSLCVQKGILTMKQAARYFTSAMEDELRFALENKSPSNLRKCICYVHKIPSLCQATENIPEMELVDERGRGYEMHCLNKSETYSRLGWLRDVLLPSLAASGDLLVYTTTTTTLSDLTTDYQEKEEEYTEELCKQFYTDVVQLIDSNAQRRTECFESFSEEVKQHLSLCEAYSELYMCEYKEMKQIEEYIVQEETHTPLIVFGGPCTGKTVLLAKAVTQVITSKQILLLSAELRHEQTSTQSEDDERPSTLDLQHGTADISSEGSSQAMHYQVKKDQMQSWIRNTDPCLVIRFMFTSQYNSCLRTLLLGICRQIAFNYKKAVKSYWQDIHELKVNFASLLTAASKQQPLVLVLDGIDQISNEDNARTMWWLPDRLSPSVKVIISTSTRKHGILNKFKNLYKDSPWFLEVKPQQKECIQMFTKCLSAVGRKITSGQQIYVNEGIKQSLLPLYVHLLYKETKCWRSYEDIDEQCLGRSVHENIERLFHKLEKNYGFLLVSKFLSYITLSKSGISEAELVDVLSMDDKILLQFSDPKKIPNILRVPDWVIESLLFDLEVCLVKGIYMGYQLLSWTNRHFPFVVWKLYLTEMDTVVEMHNVLASYFSGQWAYGRPKPLVSIGNCTLTEKQISTQQVPEQNSFYKIYVDRQQPSQPWVFNLHFANQDSVFVNMRKVIEFPFHLKECGRAEDLFKNVLTLFCYYEAMVKAGCLYQLLFEIEEACQLTCRKELCVLSDIIRKSSCILQNSPDKLSMVLQSYLLPVVDTCPNLINLFKEADQNEFKTSVVCVLHSPLTLISCMYTTLCAIAEPSLVSGIVETESLIIVTLKNGTLYTLGDTETTTIKCSNLKEDTISVVKMSSDGKYLLLSTGKNKLLIFDCTSSAFLHNMEFTKAVVEVTEILQPIKGFGLCGTDVFVWFESANLVKVFNITSAEIVKQLSCLHEVTAFSHSLDKKYIFIGQQQNVISVFESDKSLPLVSICEEISEGFIHSIFCESVHAMYIIGSKGNVSVWDITNILTPQHTEEVHKTGEYYDDVVSTEHVLEQKILLVCKTASIEIWDTVDGIILDRFKGPRNSTFLNAILSSNCEFIIAGCQNCMPLLVWKRQTGQCVLILDHNFGEITMFTKCISQTSLVAVTSKGFLLVWNSELIDHASSMGRTAKSISIILVPLYSKHFYTGDGTNVIYKWSKISFKIDTSFEHEDLVENVAVTWTEEYLVTSDISGDLYVWRTANGENMHRIQSSHVHQLLITPNSHFVVSLCENSTSKVWKLTTGHTVCNIRAYLKQAIVTPESTFVVGLYDGALLAVSLWSGRITKRFSCDRWVIAFQSLLDYPEFIILITSDKILYTWNVAEETICQQVQLSNSFVDQLRVFQSSGDGAVLVSVLDKSINILHTVHKRVCVLTVEDTVLSYKLTKTGEFIIYICYGTQLNCYCDFHSNPVLNVVQISNGKNVARHFLGKPPSAMEISEDGVYIFVGFEDGTIGSYVIVGTNEDRFKMKENLGLLENKDHTYRKLGQYSCKKSPNIVWTENGSEMLDTQV
ncbi:NACHT and WD repeat domain-containing protein 2-like [Protopterus annectens]|uniref:NACHT and WD repeat domain-containing protein 2-like n=1 Tax=Protopterus annectens TaxID=7888 RepID=UPI001CFBF72E|nr:NACHT and WD repeat domain-containing protein 2-like [Protopterus annectens]